VFILTVINFEATFVIIYMSNLYHFRDRVGKRAWDQINQEDAGFVKTRRNREICLSTAH